MIAYGKPRSARWVAVATTLALACATDLACVRRARADEWEVAPNAPSGPAVAAAPLPSRDVRWSATLGPAFDVGSLPRAAGGLAVGFDVRRGALAAHVAVAGFLPQEGRASRAPVALFGALPTVCALAPIGSRIDVGACGGAGVGVLRAASTAVRLEGLATARLDLSLSPLIYLSLELGALVDPFRTRLPLAASITADEGSRASLVSLRSSLSLQLRL